MSVFELVPRTPVTLAVAEGDTTPDPGGSGAAGCKCWSSVTSKLMTWSGTRWTAISSNGRRPKFVMIGDSQTGSSVNPMGINSINSYNSSTGVLSINQTSHGFTTNSKIRLTVRADNQWNVFAAPVTVIDANNYTVVVKTGISSPSVPAAVDLRVNKMGDMSDGGILGWLLTICPWITIVGNFGVTGETAAQIAARVPDIIKNYDFDGVIYQAAHNDITVNSNSASQILTDIKSGIAPLIAAGKQVFYINVTPFLSSYGGSTATNRARLVELNRLAARQLPELYQGLVVADIFTQAVDYTNTTTAPTAKANYINSDGLHWNPKLSHDFVVNELAPKLNLFFPARPVTMLTPFDCYDATNNPNSTNLMQNGGLLTTTGGSVNNSITGTVASQLNVSTTSGGASMVASVPAASWNSGFKSQKLAWASALTFSNAVVKIYANSQHARFSPGQKIRLMMYVKTVGLANIFNYLGLYVYCTVDGNTIYFQTSHAYGGDGATAYYQGDANGWFVTDVIYLPTGTTLSDLHWELIAYLNGTSTTSSSIEVGQIIMEVVA
jgi:lysophospholipase L1-like esterase